MRDPLRVTGVGFTTATRAQQRDGMLGFVTCTLNDALLIDSIALRRTRDHRYALSYPERTDARGRRHAVVRPLDDNARCDIERQVFEALGVKGQP